MGNMQPQNGGGRFFAAALVICFLLFLPGCRNALEPRYRPGNETSGAGALSLTIGRQDLIRTITPDSMGDFVEFRLDFSSVCDFDNQDFSETWTGDTSGTIGLNAGVWDLEVTAFLDGSPLVATATGRLAGIEIPSGGKVAGNVALFPIAQGEGTFSWDIDFSGATRISSARISITRVDVTPNVGMGILYFMGGTPLLNNPGSIELPAGQYRVIFTLANTLGDRAVLRTMLHIYRNLESRFVEEFTDEHFGIPLLDFVLGAWDGSAWDFEGGEITAATFAFLGIDGIYDDDFAAVTDWFNTLSIAGPVPVDLAGLRVLADAALIGVAIGDEGFLARNFVGRADVRDAIAERAVNNTEITLSWTDSSSVIVRIGAYEVEFVFDNAVPMVPAQGFTLDAQLAWLRANARSGNYYIVEIMSDETIAPTDGENQALPTGRSDLGIVLRGAGGMRTVSLSANGSHFWVPSSLTLILDENLTLQGRAWNNNHLVRIDSGGTLVMNEGSRITGNTNTVSNGGGVSVSSGGVFVLDGGEISGNSTTGFGGGGGVIVSGGGRFDMISGTISGNTGQNGGGVIVVSGGTFRISGGTIRGNDGLPADRNTARNNGASLSAAQGTAQLGTFDYDGTFALLGTLPTTANATIRVENGVLQRTGNLAEQLAWLHCFAQSDGEYVVEINRDETIAPTSATNQVLPTGRTNISITLRDGGGRYHVSLSANGSLFWIPYGVTLILDEHILLFGRNHNTNHLVRINNGGTLIMKGRSTIADNRNTMGSGVDAGGGVRVNSGGVLILDGGEIIANSAAESVGAGVRVESGGMFYMRSGSLGGNDNLGVRIESGGGFYMQGGRIDSNYGGGVFVVSGGRFYMQDGTISGHYGSGVSVANMGIFRISGGVIYGNEATVQEHRRNYASLARGGNAITQRGTFDDDWDFTWLGNLGTTTHNTIHVLNGQLRLAGTVNITGTAVVGQTLTANTVHLSGSWERELTFQWMRGTVKIGTDSPTYVVQAEDADSEITVIVTRYSYWGYIASGPVTVLRRGEANLTLSLADFVDMAQDIEMGIPITGPSIRLVGSPDQTSAGISVTNPEQFDEHSIRWFFHGIQVTGDMVSGEYGETLTLGPRIHGRVLDVGTHFLTVRVDVNGVPYGRRISFTVTR